LSFGKEAEITPRVEDRYQRMAARVKCVGVDASVEQVNRGIAWVYRRYAKDDDLYVLEHGAKADKRRLWANSSPTPLGSGGKIAICGRFEQPETPRYYADALSVHISEHLMRLGENDPSYNVAPGQRPWMMMLQKASCCSLERHGVIEHPRNLSRGKNQGYAPE
jgi:hypothetical protein